MTSRPPRPDALGPPRGPDRRGRARRGGPGRGALAALLALAAVGLAACGVGAEDEATLVPPDDVPPTLLEETAPTTSTTTTTEVPSASRVTVRTCLWRGERLRVTERLVRGASRPSLRALVTSEPTAGQEEAGLRSRLVPDLIRQVRLGRGVARVDLDARFAELSSTGQLAALAQVACTLTSQPGVGQAAFTLEEAPIEVPRGDGSLTSDPVSRDDYESLIGPPATSSSTTTSTAP